MDRGFSDEAILWRTLPTTISGAGVAIHETAGLRAHWGNEREMRRAAAAMLDVATDPDLVCWMDPVGPTGLLPVLVDGPTGSTGYSTEVDAALLLAWR